MRCHEQIFKLGLVCLSISLLVGCSLGVSRPDSYAPVMTSDAINKVDRDIAKLEKDIQSTRDAINQMSIEDFQVKKELEHNINFPHSSDYAMTGGQNPGDSNMGRVVRVTNDIEQGRKVLEQQKKELAKLQKEKQKLVQQSTGCFPAETLVVMADGSRKKFAEIVVGDFVQTFDIGYEKTVPRKVVEIYQVDGNHLYSINGALLTSGGERLLSQRGWREVRNLEVGDSVHIAGQMVKVERIELSRQNIRLYNMQVADTHNFYISTAEQGAFLVHNSGGGGGGGK